MSVVDRCPVHGVTEEFVARLAERADEAERLRRLPAATVTEFKQTDLIRLLLPGPVRRHSSVVSRTAGTGSTDGARLRFECMDLGFLCTA